MALASSLDRVFSAVSGSGQAPGNTGRISLGAGAAVPGLVEVVMDAGHRRVGPVQSIGAPADQRAVHLVPLEFVQHGLDCAFQ